MAAQLPLVSNSLARTKQDCDDGALSPGAQDMLAGVVEACRRQIVELDKLADKILPSAADSALRRGKKAAVAAFREKDVRAVHQQLSSAVTVLTLYFSQRAAAPPCALVGDGDQLSGFFEVPPTRVAHMVRRPKLLEAIQRVFDKGSGSSGDGGGAPKIAGLLGLGGQGKTQLALEYCRAARAAGKFESVFWFDASSAETVSRGFARVAAKLAPGRVFASLAAKVQHVKDMLARQRAPWLMVCDNYDQPAEFPDVASFFPQRSTAGAVLFTSRHAAAERLGAVVRMAGMTDNEALELPFRQSELKPNNAGVHVGGKIVRQLGHLPLAVDQAGAYISARKLSLEDFLMQYGERRDELFKLKPDLWEYSRRLGDDWHETKLSVFTTWDLAFQQFGHSDTERKYVRHFLTLAASYDITRIGEDVFRRHHDRALSAPKWIRSFTCRGKWDSHRYRNTLVELYGLSLVQNVELSSAETAFSLHPLVADWLHAQLSLAERQRCVVEAMAVLRDYAGFRDLDTVPLADRLEMLAHVDAFVGSSMGCLGHEAPWAEALVRDAARVFANLYYHWARYWPAGQLLRRSLAAYERTVQPTDPALLAVVGSLGNVYAAQNKTAEADKMYQRSFQGAERALSPDNPMAFELACRLGYVYVNRGELAEAEEKYSQALVSCENALGPNNCRTLKLALSLAYLYTKQDNFTKAEGMFRQTMERHEAILGSEHPSTMAVVYGLAVLLHNKGEPSEAEKLYQRSLVGLEKTFGRDHPTVFDSVVGLGLCYRQRGDKTQAEKMYQRALTGRLASLGPDHPKTLRLLLLLGLLYYQDLHDLAKAETMFQSLRDRGMYALGLENDLTLDACHNLGVVHEANGKTAAAEAAFQSAVEGYGKMLGPNHRKTRHSVAALERLRAKPGRSGESDRCAATESDGPQGGKGVLGD